MGVAILLNSKKPASGHTRYLVGFPYRGFWSVTTRAASVALFGMIRNLDGFSAAGGRLYVVAVVAGFAVSAFAFAFVVAAVPLVDLVLAMADCK